MQAYKSNRRQFGFQAIQIWSSIIIRFWLQRRYCLNNGDFDINLIYFRSKSIVSIFFLDYKINWYQFKDQKSWLKDWLWLKDQKRQFLLKKFIYFDYFDHFWTILKQNRSISIYINFLIKSGHDFVAMI